MSPIVHVQCPYCGFGRTVEIKNLMREQDAFRCVDCREMFAVEIHIDAQVQVHALAGVDKSQVLDRLLARSVASNAPHDVVAVDPEPAPAKPPQIAEAPAPTAAAPGPSVEVPQHVAVADTAYTALSYDKAKAAGKHMHSSACWCRAKRPTPENKWCKLLIDNRGKNKGNQRALETPAPRAERYKVRRVTGTYGGG